MNIPLITKFPARVVVFQLRANGETVQLEGKGRRVANINKGHYYEIKGISGKLGQITKTRAIDLKYVYRGKKDTIYLFQPQTDIFIPVMFSEKPKPVYYCKKCGSIYETRPVKCEKYTLVEKRKSGDIVETHQDNVTDPEQKGKKVFCDGDIVEATPSMVAHISENMRNFFVYNHYMNEIRFKTRGFMEKYLPLMYLIIFGIVMVMLFYVGLNNFDVIAQQSIASQDLALKLQEQGNAMLLEASKYCAR